MLSILGQFPRPFSSDLFRKFTNLEEFFRCPESQGWREVLGGGGGKGAGVGGVPQKRQSPDFMSPELLLNNFYLNSTTFFESLS